MAWKQRGARWCYYRTRRVGRAVKSEYVGAGAVAELAAAADARRRAARRAAAEANRAERARLLGGAAPLLALCDATDLLARAALVAAGYRQHDRGEWRRRRNVPPTAPEPDAGAEPGGDPAARPPR